MIGTSFIMLYIHFFSQLGNFIPIDWLIFFRGLAIPGCSSICVSLDVFRLPWRTRSAWVLHSGKHNYGKSFDFSATSYGFPMIFPLFPMVFPIGYLLQLFHIFHTFIYIYIYIHIRYNPYLYVPMACPMFEAATVPRSRPSSARQAVLVDLSCLSQPETRTRHDIWRISHNHRKSHRNIDME